MPLDISFSPANFPTEGKNELKDSGNSVFGSVKIKELRPSSVGILGGMGPAAGADFVRLFVRACETVLRSRGWPVTDQTFPEHWLAQVPVPDRTNALLGRGATPLPGLISGLRRLSGLGVRAVAISCNTAHAWHEELQLTCPDVELLHIVRKTVAKLASDKVEVVGLMATLGTHQTMLYEAELFRAGIRCHTPLDQEQAIVMEGIRNGVKGGNLGLARELFEKVAGQLVKRHQISTLVLACTEIPLALRGLPRHPEVRLVDPSAVLAQALAEHAYAHTPLAS